MQGSIRIRVGASADRSIESTFASIEARAKRAGQVVQQQLAGTGRGGPYRSRPTPNTARFDTEARAAERSARRQERAAQDAARAQVKAARDVTRAVAAEAAKQSRAQVAAQERFARRTSYRATRFLFPPPSGILGSARRMGSDMLAGAGIDFNMSAAFARNVALQKSAIALSNQGYNPADRRNATRVAPEQLMAEARATGSKYGFDPAEIMKAHDAFVSLTGDLDTSRKSMGDMAKLAAATGTSIEDMAAAQAEASNALGNTENKSAKLEAIMRTLAGQGKVGAVEIKNMAKGLAAITSAAPQFAGDVGKNIEKLSALAEIAKETGGARNAAEAMTGVARFTSTLTTPARLKQFKAAGITVYDKQGKIRDPFELIKESLVATKGDPLKMSKLFQSVMGKRAVQGLVNDYNAAGGGQRGLAAVNAHLAKFSEKAALSKGMVDENATRAASSDAAKAQRFQNELDKVAASLQSSLLPALEKAGPKVLELAEAFSKAVQWATDNPGKAITVAIVGAIARAGLESAARGALEKAIMAMFRRNAPGPSPTTPTPPGTPGPGGGGWGQTAGGVALALTGGAIIAQGANELRDKLGMKRSAAGLIHGYDEKGEFSVGQLLKDTAGGTFEKSIALGGEVGRRFANWRKGRGFTDMEMHSGVAASMERASGGAVAARPLTAADIGSALASRELRVRVTNPGDIKNDGAQAPEGGRSPKNK